MAASLGMAATAVAEAVAAVKIMEVRPLEVHWRAGRMQTVLLHSRMLWRLLRRRYPLLLLELPEVEDHLE